MQFLMRLIHISLQNMNDIARNTIYGGFLANHIYLSVKRH